MAKFPVEISDSQAIVDGLNYVLSGPSGLGQNFSGFSSSEPATLTGNFRAPYTVVPVVTTPAVFNGDIPTSNGQGQFQITITDPSLLKEGMLVKGTGIAAGARIAAYGIPTTVNKSTITLDLANTGPVSGLINFYNEVEAELYDVAYPITLATVEWVDKYTVRAWFATPWTPTAAAPVPFALGNSPQIRSSSIADYNIFYRGPGVVECTTTYVVLQAGVELANQGTATGGNIRAFATLNPPTVGQAPGNDYWIKTDCLARVTVNGPTDRVFLSGQLHNVLSYTALSGTPTLEYTVAINRYLGIPFSDPVNPDYRFLFNGTVAERVYTFTGLSGTAALDEIETIFATFIDTPPPAYYVYRLEVGFRVINSGATLQVTKSNVDLRALSCQVVKL
jgi:hypothetical protein